MHMCIKRQEGAKMSPEASAHNPRLRPCRACGHAIAADGDVTCPKCGARHSWITEPSRDPAAFGCFLLIGLPVIVIVTYIVLSAILR